MSAEAHAAGRAQNGRRPAQGEAEEPGRARVPEESDELLLAQCRQGSEAAFAALVRRHERALRRHCETMVGQSAASDATQEAFLSAWSAIRAGAEVQRVRPWLFTIAHRKALGLLRERRRAPVELLEESLSNGVSSAEQAQRTARARETLAVLAALPEEQRAALLGVAVHGRSGRQVARTLGVSESSARQLVFRARATLRAGTADCVGPPLLVAGWIRRLLAGARRLGGTAGAGAGSESAVATAKLAAVAVLGVATVGASALRLSTRPHAQSGEHSTLVAPRTAADTLAETAGRAADAPASSASLSAGARRLTVARVAGPHRSPPAPAAPGGVARGSAAPSMDALEGSPVAGAQSATAPATASAATASSRDPAGTAVEAPASILDAASANTSPLAPSGLSRQVVALGGAGAGALRHTVAGAGGTVRKAVQSTAASAKGAVSSVRGTAVAAEGTVATSANGAVSSAKGAVSSAKGAVSTVTSAAGITAAASGGPSAPAGASVTTSAASTSGGGQAVDDTVPGVGAVGSQALAPVSAAASSTVTKTVGAVTSTTSGGAGEVAQGATGAVSTLGHLLTGG